MNLEVLERSQSPLRKKHTKFFLAITLRLCVFAFGSSAWAQGQEIIFSATGDVPYSAVETATFQQQLANHNKYSPSAFFVHLGDIFLGGEPCDNAHYAPIANLMKSLAVPVYIIPGDNETIDCDTAAAGLLKWKQYFINYEQNFCSATPTEHQTARPENWAFVKDGVLFVGINMVGGNSPYQLDADWITRQFEANVTQVRAAVIFSHIGPDKSTTFSTPFRLAAAAFAKPVLFLHGHGHAWNTGYPFPEPNIFRVQVDNGTAEDPVEVTVTMDMTSPATAFVLKRNPWTSQTIVNMPPCVNAGPDQTIIFPQAAALNAGASDDGDPVSPGTLTTTWSKISGPGTVTLGNANALNTTASFSSIGIYVLRLTANDGTLQTTDDVTIEVSDGIPIIASFSPVEGAAGTEVTLTGNYFTGTTSVTFNNLGATNFVVDNATQIRATVPVGITTGKIRVTNSNGTGASATDFTARYLLTLNTFGFGSVTLNPAGGVYDAGTVVTLTATPALGFQFSGWSGNLSGTSNPTTLTMNADKNVTAIFTATSPIGQITHEETRTGGSSSSLKVKTSAPLTAAGGQLYLAAISTRPKVSVLSLSGLGLNWTLVKAQCSGRNATHVEVWKALGTPTSNDTVTATLASAPNNAAIAVSRYSGVESVSPVGNFISGNTVGVNGACSGGIDTSLYSFQLATTANNAVVYAAAAMRAKTHAPGAGYTERADVLQGGVSNTAASVAIEDQRFASAATITVNGSFNGAVDWAVVALEMKPQLSLTLNTAGSGSVTLDPPGGEYNPGTVVTLTATPATEFEFSGWSGDLSGSNNPTALTMNGNKTVTAIFTPQLTLTTNTVGSGTVTLNPAGGIYNANTVVRLTATPATGFEFSGWSGDLSGSANLDSLTMNGNKTVTATFAALPPPQYNLTANKIGSGTVTLDPAGGIYNASAKVKLTATPAEGFAFSGWSGDLNGAANPDSITMNANKTVTATFTQVPAGIAHAETRIGGASNLTTVTTFGNLTSANGHLYLAAISTRPKVSVQSVEGLGLNWKLVKAKCAGRNTTAIEVWMAQGTPTGDAAVTATLANAPGTAVIAVSRYSGVVAVNPIGNVLAGNANGANASGACSGGVDKKLYSFNLATTMNGAFIYGATAIKAQTHAPGAGFVERTEVKQANGVNISGVAIEDKQIAFASTTTVNGSLSNVADWAVVAVEIKPQFVTQFALTVNTSGSGNVTLNPPGGVYNSGTVVTLTANPAAGFQFTGWSGALSDLTNPAAMTMDANKTVTANFIPSNSVIHEETRAGAAANSIQVKTSASLIGASDHLYLATISTRPKVSVSSVSGLGLSWNLVRAKCSGRNTTGIEVWKAIGEPSSDDTVTATFASAPGSAVIAVSRYSGVEVNAPIGNSLAGNTKGVNASAGCSGGSDNNSYSFNIAATLNGAVIYGATALKTRTHTPGPGYTERAEIQQPNGDNTCGLAVQDKLIFAAGNGTVNGSFNGVVDWTEVALEIKPESALGKKGERAENEKPLATAPSTYQLYQNYPNPFNAQSVIEYDLPQASSIKLVIYNTVGQIVRRLVDETQFAGRHRAVWNGMNDLGAKAASGVYFYQLEIGVQKLTRKMVLMQ